MRMYAALENVIKTKSLYWRRRYYWSRTVLKPMGPLNRRRKSGSATSAGTCRARHAYHRRRPRRYWQDLATLELLLKHGSRRFWLDDIWEKDWTSLLRQQGLSWDMYRHRPNFFAPDWSSLSS